MISEVYGCLFIKLNQFDLKSATIEGTDTLFRDVRGSHDIHSIVTPNCIVVYKYSFMIIT